MKSYGEKESGGTLHRATNPYLYVVRIYDAICLQNNHFKQDISLFFNKSFNFRHQFRYYVYSNQRWTPALFFAFHDRAREAKKEAEQREKKRAKKKEISANSCIFLSF